MKPKQNDNVILSHTVRTCKHYWEMTEKCLLLVESACLLLVLWLPHSLSLSTGFRTHNQLRTYIHTVCVHGNNQSNLVSWKSEDYWFTTEPYSQPSLKHMLPPSSWQADQVLSWPLPTCSLSHPSPGLAPCSACGGGRLSCGCWPHWTN